MIGAQELAAGINDAELASKEENPCISVIGKGDMNRNSSTGTCCYRHVGFC
jgi:hypothetical protein